MLVFNLQAPISSRVARMFRTRWYFSAWHYVNSIIDYRSSAVNFIKAKVVYLVIGVIVSA